MTVIPEVAGVLARDDVLRTARSIAEVQQADGGVPWPDGHVDAWNHIECLMAMSVAGLVEPVRRGYEWLVRHQRVDGSWPMKIVDGRAVEHGGESNHAAYIAVGVWHELLVTGDEDFAREMWPVVRSALNFVVDLQTPRGEIVWERTASGRPADYALLTGCSSIHQALRCALALAEHREDPQPDWELALGQLGHAIRNHPERFLDKSRYSMDWYYPVLGGAVTGPAAKERIERDWDRFVVPGLGVRCVLPNPWVTGGESAELALALWAMGESDRALDILRWIQHLRAENGLYWTGYVFEDDAVWPEELTAWTAGSLLLAVAALGGDEATVTVFGGEGLPVGLEPDCC